MITALQVYEWLKSSPNQDLFKELRYENDICKIHVKENIVNFSKSLNLFLGETSDPMRDDVLIYAHQWDSIDECDNGKPMKTSYVFK